LRWVLCLLPLAFLSLGAQTIEINPPRVMIDEPAAIRVTGCGPNEKITIDAELTDGAGARWVSESEFVADALGIVDTSKQAPVAGSYTEVSATGLIWPMKPSGSKAGRYQPPRDLGAQTVDFRVMRNATGRFHGASRTNTNCRRRSPNSASRWLPSWPPVRPVRQRSASRNPGPRRVGRRHAIAPGCLVCFTRIRRSRARLFPLRRSAPGTRRHSP
jgi:hypothetical protein